MFEPRHRAVVARVPGPRLPLIYEFEGVCHAGEEVISAEHSFKYCNQGNAKNFCKSFPAELPVSSIRFSALRKTPQRLTVMIVEEENYWPRTWNQVDFVVEDERLEPEIADTCRRAQLIHFCVSYLENTK